MTAKEFLRRARGIDRLVDEAQERAIRMRAKLEAGRRNTLTGMPRGGGSDWTETADRLIELEQAVDARFKELVAWKLAAIRAVSEVREPKLRRVLELYYIDGFSWDEVAKRMSLDPRWVFRLHGEALLRISVPREFDH